MECDYVIPDGDELEYMTLLANTEPEDYPTAEAAKNELLSAPVKVKVKTDYMPDVYEVPPSVQLTPANNPPANNNINNINNTAVQKNVNMYVPPSQPQQKTAFEKIYDWWYDHFYIGYILLLILAVIMPSAVDVAIGGALLIPDFEDDDPFNPNKLKIGAILLIIGLLKFQFLD
ncbi:MAG: hypothetical protein IJ446_05345 [Oscillospiraceae bacterium]|nr:hypothetical protein [Oscillospiraceae bacterium]